MENYYLALLSAIEGVNYTLCCILLEKLKTAQNLWQAPFEELLAVGMPEQRADKFVQARKKIGFTADKLADFCEKENINIVTHRDKAYPVLLKQISNPPLSLFVKGHLPAGEDNLAMVGSRKATAYGRSVAEQFAADLSRSGFTIVSGGAKGIDTFSHEGALSVQGKTVAVFGCGIDVVYPKENAKVFDRILAAGGALVSEYLPGQPPISWHFPMRNRIISGMCKGVLLVEANKKSGSLITANFALEENREVYCVPGSIYSAGSIGTHNLIKQGAMLVDCPEDITADLGCLFAGRSRPTEEKSYDSSLQGISEDAVSVYQKLVAGKYYPTDEIIMVTGFDAAKVLFALLELEISGWVKLEAGTYQKVERKR